MDNSEHESNDNFETPRGCHSTLSDTSSDSKKHDFETDAEHYEDAENTVNSGIDVESISIALDNGTPSTSASNSSDDHKTNRNILSMQKEEAFSDWLAAKKFVYTKM